jgi:hypothetical protein
MLINHVPDPQIERLLVDTNIIYLEGDSLNEKGLRRAQLEKCKAVVLLCNKLSPNPQEEDAMTIL